jgi:hypothetical protein
MLSHPFGVNTKSTPPEGFRHNLDTSSRESSTLSPARPCDQDDQLDPKGASMRSRQLDLSVYDTDKITNRYLIQYEPFLAPYVDAPVKLLELGIHRGGSLRLWRDYFARGSIVGIDAHAEPASWNEERIRVYRGLQQDTAFLSRVAQETAPEGFDIIIDDASHVGALSRTTFWHLLPHHLKPGGLYVIEDWGTGYWADWPDGQSYRPRTRARSLLLSGLRRLGLLRRVAVHTHCYGMVGFIKELVDEQGMHDLSRRTLHGSPVRGPALSSVTITPSAVFVKKWGTSSAAAA